MLRTELSIDAGDEPVSGDADSCCPLCQGRRLHYAFSLGDRRVVRCAECRLVLFNPRPGTGVPPVEQANIPFLSLQPEPADISAARVQLLQLARYRGHVGGAMLVVDSGEIALAMQAASIGFDTTRVCLRPGWTPGSPPAEPLIPCGASTEIGCADLASAALAPESFDICVLNGSLEVSRDPLEMLRTVRALLKPDGVLMVATCSLDALCERVIAQDRRGGSSSARSTYFDFDTIQTAMHRTGFDQAIVHSPRRADSRLEVDGMIGRAASAIVGAIRSAVEDESVPPGGVLAIARAASVPACRTLSVIVPAFNEAGTVGALLDALLAKRIAGMRIEVIVVESNSSDGTRDIVLKYADHPRLRVVLEERPSGKGHAVRTGLAQATGDYVLIQDADLEYDLEDYDVLLEPLAAGRQALVLGSRHGGNAWWKMRQFAGQPMASFALNCGHWFFTTLLNILFGQRLKDPFTMYKVFRRDCIFGLDFKCNRFDFDYELLVKMIRKGYKPVEIPVNYRSRSFKEGKKVSAFRDPFNWLKALAWLRFVPVDPLAEIEHRRAMSGALPSAEVMMPAPKRAAA